MDFQGFQNPYPLFIIVLAIALLIGISWWSYRSEKNIPLNSRIGLTILRSVSLIILMLLLLNPFFYSSKDVKIEPGIAVFLDNSESVAIHKGSYMGLESYHELIERLSFKSVDEAQFHFYSIGESTKEFDPDSLNAVAPQTNISDAVNTVLEFNESIKAAIFISDGIITYGKNPVFSATSSAIPLHTIAIGDTSEVQDILISNVLTNGVGYTNTTQNVEVEIKQTQFKDHEITVKLKSEEKVIQQKNVSFETDEQVKKLVFELQLAEAGLQQFEIEAEKLKNEWTFENNSSFFSVDVLDNKVKILHIAFEIHPDVKTIRSIIKGDINNELTTLTWVGKDQFIEDLPNKYDFNLVIIHGSSNTGYPSSLMDKLQNIPSIYFSLPSSIAGRDALDMDHELISPQSNELIQAVLNPLLNENEHSVLELPAIDFSETPTLTAPMESQIDQIGSTALFGLMYDNIKINNPVIAVYEQGNLRRSHVLPWGWYGLKLSKSQQHRTFVEHLINNLISWTSSDPDEQLLQIKPERQTFSTFENPSLSATLKNESGENEDNAIIEVVITSDNGNTSAFNMQSTGNGSYSLDLPRYTNGLYKFKATARKGNRIIDEKSGEFLVANSSSELTDTHRNDALLKAIANNSGGLFFTYNNVENFWDSLAAEGILEPQNQTIEKYAYPVRSIVWFVIVLLLLTTEWMLRKYYSLS